MTTTNTDASGVVFEITGESLLNKIMPHLLIALRSDAALRNTLITAILPLLRQQLATKAQQTAGGRKP